MSGRPRSTKTYRIPLVLPLALFGGLLGPQQAYAHAFGARYDLPLPLWHYVAGAGAAVLLSFVVMVLFVRPKEWSLARRQLDLSGLPFLPAFRQALRVCSVVLFFTVLGAGFFGDPDPTRNLAPVFIWIVWWVGLALVQSLVGDLWAVVNPLEVLFSWFESLYCGLLGKARFGLGWPVPSWLATWPAVPIFLAFASLELVPEASANPRQLTSLILNYSLVTWFGMFVFGKQAWLQRGEAFTVVFGIFARFAPLGGRPSAGQPDCAGGGLYLRPPGVGLLCDRPLPLSSVVLVVLMLATVSFDGFTETQLWAGWLDWVGSPQGLLDLLVWLQGAGIDSLVAVQGAGLVAAPLLFLAVFGFFSALTARAGSRGPIMLRESAGSFVLTLVPIAIAYHLAHYASYLIVTGQLALPLFSDPFGLGWDLLGLRDYQPDIGLLNIKFIWYLAVSAIVIGHVYAVYLAHVMALRLYRDGRSAILSQLPMLALMVAYTMVSLWILSQPIVV